MRRPLPAFIVLLFAAASVFDASDPPRDLYALAATPTPYSPETFPARLYRIKPDKTLELIRGVVSATDGVYSVSAGGDTLSVAYPLPTPTSISIVHKSDPARVDNLQFNPKAMTVDGFKASLALVKGETVQILPLIASRMPRKLDFVRAVLEPPGASPRVTSGSADDYGHILADGAAGGPEFGFSLIAETSGNDIVVDAGEAQGKVDILDPAVPIANRNIQVLIVAANDRFLIALQVRKPGEMSSAASTTINYVHNRKRGSWTAVDVPGNASSQRLFGDWLATIKQTWSPNNTTNPGRKEERGYGTPNLPNVQLQYAGFRGRNQVIPGVLILTNLDDGRRIAIETHMEDSEILDVDGDEVLYRVNDAIYQAEIKGTALGPATAVAKDEDVPEVHWVFRSK